MKPAESISEPMTSHDGSPIGEQLTGLSGPIPPGHLFVVASRYHAEACDSMTAAAIEAMVQAGVSRELIHVVRVPGAWELPLAVQTALQLPHSLGAVAIGVVIRGETTHDEHINRAVSLELMQLGTEYGKPVGLGLLTCNTVEQVRARTGGELGNKGTEAAAAVLEMLRVNALIRSGRCARPPLSC